ncbi:MAG TPA: hypothetical protein EYQ50_11135 [Verrucomicrobiales bacterium]|nr:hypothetical protein [Verrucomicrobiales bacterium]HIL71979.1 hypothetical protein [Verrucomicrobiota bacterium]
MINPTDYSPESNRDRDADQQLRELAQSIPATGIPRSVGDLVAGKVRRKSLIRSTMMGCLIAGLSAAFIGIPFIDWNNRSEMVSMDATAPTQSLQPVSSEQIFPTLSDSTFLATPPPVKNLNLIQEDLLVMLDILNNIEMENL